MPWYNSLSWIPYVRVLIYKSVRLSLHAATLRIQIPFTCPQSNLICLSYYRTKKLKALILLRFQRARILIFLGIYVKLESSKGWGYNLRLLRKLQFPWNHMRQEQLKQIKRRYFKTNSTQRLLALLMNNITSCIIPCRCQPHCHKHDVMSLLRVFCPTTRP
jgi:hypothetical protein